jgi:hypothetical protein
MSRRFVKIISIATLSVFLTGCIGDNNSSSQQQEQAKEEQEAYEYGVMASANYDEAMKNLKEGNIVDAGKGFYTAAKDFIKSKIHELMALVKSGQSSFQLGLRDKEEMVNKYTVENISSFYKKAHTPVRDFIVGDKIPYGDIVKRYASSTTKDDFQRLIATVELHEAAVGGTDNPDDHPFYSILCNSNCTVDFGFGQVNTISWIGKDVKGHHNKGPCEGMVDPVVIRKATEMCQSICKPNNNLHKGIRAYIINYFRSKNSDPIRDPHSPFNPFVNAACTYKHLQTDLLNVRKRYDNCDKLHVNGLPVFRCVGSPSKFDYWTLTLIEYGGNTDNAIKKNIRWGKTTLEAYISEFRSAYTVLYGDRPPF